MRRQNYEPKETKSHPLPVLRGQVFAPVRFMQEVCLMNHTKTIPELRLMIRQLRTERNQLRREIKALIKRKNLTK